MPLAHPTQKARDVKLKSTRSRMVVAAAAAVALTGMMSACGSDDNTSATMNRMIIKVQHEESAALACGYAKYTGTMARRRAGIEARVWPTLEVILVELPNASSAQVRSRDRACAN